MNFTFWALMIVMLLVAIAVLVFPLLKVRTTTPLVYKQSNLQIHNEKLNELDVDLKEGRIDRLLYRAARDELDRELLIDVPAESVKTTSLHYNSMAKRHPVWALTITVFVPMLVLMLYLNLGMHAASDKSSIVMLQQGQQTQQAKQPPSVEEMTRKLKARVAENGGTTEEWAMLARAHKYLGEYELAANAFAVALESDANNAQLMLENAEVIALGNNRVFTPEAKDLVLKAYSLEPDNENVLWFAGVVEYQQGNYRQAINHLTKLLPRVRGEEDVLKSVISMVAKSREQLIAAGEEMPELKDLLAATMVEESLVEANRINTPSSKAEKAPVTELTIAVDVSAAVREKFAEDDLVFVYAKAKQGPRMPLAVQRMSLAEIPLNVTLDDSMAMVSGMNLSAYENIVVSARVTKSGSAIAQSGDYIGQIEIKDKASTNNVEIVIDTLVP